MITSSNHPSQKVACFALQITFQSANDDNCIIAQEADFCVFFGGDFHPLPSADQMSIKPCIAPL